MQMKMIEPPTLEEFVSKIEAIKSKSLEFAALVSLIYLSASRVSEVIGQFTYNVYGGYLHGVRQKDMFEQDYKGSKFLVIRTRVSKMRAAYLKKFPQKAYKKAYINLKDTYNQRLVAIIEEYGAELPQNAESEIFSFQYNKFWSWCRNILAINPHILRDWRCSHLSFYYNFTEADLRIYVGWAPASPMPQRYSRSGERMILERELQAEDWVNAQQG